MLMICLSLAVVPTVAQTAWTMQRCMQYAVAHNHAVKQAELELDNYEAGRTAAFGRLLPGVDAGIGAQYNFGRAIDPETNGYTDVSTFHNGYELRASMPVFDGFSRIHALRAAKASMLMGRHALRERQDQTALATLQAWVDQAYYEKTVAMAEEKLSETSLLLKQTRLLEEVGRKSSADVAQIEAQHAEAAYELTRQQSLLAQAALELKKTMNLPLSDTIRLAYNQPVGRLSEEPGLEPTGLPVGVGQSHPALQTAYYSLQVKRHEWRQARAALFPSLSLSAGLNTTYYHTLHASAGQAFHTQFKNNMGEYVGATLSIPLFSRLQTITGIRRAKNNYRIACEEYAQKQLELEKLSREAWQDWQGYRLQTEQMTKKVEADSIAYRLTRRQFEEGLSTAIDLHMTSAQLLKSKATLLQCQLMTIVKEQLVRYYRGETIWTE